MRYALQRTLQLILVFVLVSFGVLVLMRLGSGDARELARRLLGSTPSEQRVTDIVARYHLDENYVVQYLYWLRDFVFHFDLGFSEVNQTTVAKLLLNRLPTTCLLTVYAIGFGMLFAVPLAVLQAHRRDTWFDRLGNTMSFIGIGVPAIVLGVMVQWLFAIKLGWFPALSSKIFPWQDLGAHVENFFLPTLILVIVETAIFARVLRADMVTTLQSDFVTLASAKGLPVRRVLWRHALHNSLFSVITSVGTTLGGLIGGAIVVEQLFDLDGVGNQMLASVLSRDMFTVQGFVAVIILVVVVVNLLVDLTYSWIDPRIRAGRALA